MVIKQNISHIRLKFFFHLVNKNKFLAIIKFDYARFNMEDTHKIFLNFFIHGHHLGLPSLVHTQF